jgi:phosphate/sulfate permease
MLPEYYLILVGLLLLLAILDLVVGVSNDAVNFLNAAVGSGVATRRVILLVASLGILLGSTFSSGMMEVARSGIFHPGQYVFAEVMVIFLAVMLTDIILLDVFNSLGMPTSTTVSIVFELLGAAVAVAVFRLLTGGEGLDQLGRFIHFSGALIIIFGIFLSVSIAFTVGVLVQWLSRLFFTFHYQRRLPWIGGLWSGLALMAISYFLFIKGMKGASFVPSSWVVWMEANTTGVLLASFAFWTLLMHFLLVVFRVNILRLVVLAGTFALAMAFASNDLVNFIGVPMAGLESFRLWEGSGIPPSALSMEGLQRAVRTDTLLLILAGLIMITTLWFSRKARTVTETEVNLARQGDGAERFKPNALARGIVQATRQVSVAVKGILPIALLEMTEARFRPLPAAFPVNGTPQPSFDLVRASVNLTAASALIALATSFKLPLSTTYVSFMVAMGTSLADRAWGQGSAVFRVAGVLNVIGGWFLTAVAAFSAAAIFALLISLGGIWAVGFLFAAAMISIVRTRFLHRRMLKKKGEAATLMSLSGTETSRHLARLFQEVGQILDGTLEGILQEKPAVLKQHRRDLEALRMRANGLQRQLYQTIRQTAPGTLEQARQALLVYDLEQDLLQSARLIVEESHLYVDNCLPPLQRAQVQMVGQLRRELGEYLRFVGQSCQQSGGENRDAIQLRKQSLFLLIEEGLTLQVEGIRSQHYGMRNSYFLFVLLLEVKDLVAVSARFGKALAGTGGFWPGIGTLSSRQAV